MGFTKTFKINLILNFFLILSFSVSVNSFTTIPDINIISYIFFHLTLIYLLFYHYNFTIYLIIFVYGILLDIFLLNSLGSHLLSFIFLTLLFIILRKYLFQLSQYQIIVVLYGVLLSTLIMEILLSYILSLFIPDLEIFIKIFIFSAIIFIPSIFLFNKIDN